MNNEGARRLALRWSQSRECGGAQHSEKPYRHWAQCTDQIPVGGPPPPPPPRQFSGRDTFNRVSKDTDTYIKQCQYFMPVQTCANTPVVGIGLFDTGAV